MSDLTDPADHTVPGATAPELVRVAADRSIATLTLDSPANRNALSARLVGELGARLTAAADDPGVRAVVLTHTGGTFCSGADLREQRAEGGPAGGTSRMLALLRQLVELPKPVIARVDGHVRAGGLGLVGACDLALAGPAATFAFTEVRLGLAPAIISLTTLPRLSSRAFARYGLTGEVFDGPAAAACGLVTVAADDAAALDRELLGICDALRACSPQGLAETKAISTSAMRADFDGRADAMRELSARLFASDEAREGMAAFLAKRAPAWNRGS